jgi:hydrogenase maturation protein HypF
LRDKESLKSFRLPVSIQEKAAYGDSKGKILKRPTHLHASTSTRIRKRIVLTGILQGIGCRPTVYRLALELGLAGWVVNTPEGVVIEIEGDSETCERFQRELTAAIPFPGRIDRMRVQEIPPLGELDFRIEASVQGERSITPIPPDVAVCKDCVGELLDPENHRYLYPFITCTLCGPRFTVVRSFPYDRERTSMADFTMCPECRREYSTPSDRRFHSQTNSCAICGPRLSLTDPNGFQLGGDPIVESIALLKQGKVLGIKGVGGFHLACDASNEDAVRILRERKGRVDKPFAVMMRDLKTVRQYCSVGTSEEALLTCATAPIVLLEATGRKLASGVAPFMGALGVMLPYAPLHHLLLKHPEVPARARFDALVMTSGNRSEEPIAKGNDEALERLRDLVDAFLTHDREIVLRADDSIFRVIAGTPTVLRRSRGLVPGGFNLAAASSEEAEGGFQDKCADSLSRTDPVILGAGGDLKNALAIIKGNQAVPGPHVGDLASPVAQEYFRESVKVLTGYLEAVPEIIAVDPHPEYFSTTLAQENQIPVEEVFHHHAHAVSLLFQHGLPGPALFAVFDGTGYGTDGTIWGGEFLVADRETFTRVAHLSLFPLPGGEAAIREPVRILAGLLTRNAAFPEEFMPLMGEHGSSVKFWIEAIRKSINCPMTSSAGRLFDAAAAAAGFTRSVTFEGQAAMWLEGVADKKEGGEYPLRFVLEGETIIVDCAALILNIARDMVSGIVAEVASARFHNSIARAVAETSAQLAEKTGIKVVGLTGGCFQNKMFTERTKTLLDSYGFETLLHETVPPNDGGIALGQAVAARARVMRRSVATQQEHGR